MKPAQRGMGEKNGLPRLTLALQGVDPRRFADVGMLLMSVWRRQPQRLVPRSPIALALGLGAALGFASVAWGLPMPEATAVSGGAPLWVLAQAPGGDSARVAIAGARLIVRSAPKGNSRIVDHIEKGSQVVVVDSQPPWAKIQDYQSGRPLGWVYQSLLIAPGG